MQIAGLAVLQLKKSKHKSACIDQGKHPNICCCIRILPSVTAACGVHVYAWLDYQCNAHPLVDHEALTTSTMRLLQKGHQSQNCSAVHAECYGANVMLLMARLRQDYHKHIYSTQFLAKKRGLQRTLSHHDAALGYCAIKPTHASKVQQQRRQAVRTNISA